MTTKTSMSDAISNLIKEQLEDILITQPEQQIDQGSKIDMLDNLLRPGSYMNWLRVDYVPIKYLYDNLAKAHTLNDEHMTFAEFTFALWFNFHNIKVDLAFSS